MKTLTFYFALRSPYSALASDIVHEAAESGAFTGKAAFRIAPFGAPGTGFQDPTSNPLKLRYMMQDLPRLYAARGLSVTVPDPFQVDFSIAAKLALAAQRDDLGLGYLRAISLLRWSEGRNVAEAEVLLEAAERAGWSIAAAERALTDVELDQAYEAAIAAGEAAGVFGVPFFIVTDGDAQEPFWGQDRWPMVAAALAG
ncbi:MAG: DsbA family protein [Pseudomonadota bacterium]